MLRLYLRFYLALIASLFLFVIATATLWHYTVDPADQAGVTLSRLVQNILPPAKASAADQQAALSRLAEGLNGNVTLFNASGIAVAAIGQPIPFPGDRHHDAVGMFRLNHAPVSYVRLNDGRWLVASVPMGDGHARAGFHLMLVLLALAIGIGAYPIVRQISRRLERLQQGVESLGAGDFKARVAVEGRDEVARLATSFNRAAAQIEQMMNSHKSLLANTSHELRTPLTRIRLGVELMKQSVDAERKRGLEQDIAELDQLVDEILLASRLDSLAPIAADEFDLLAIAAEECARYEQTQLEGSMTPMHGDARLIHRLLRNLLDNALRHGAPPTHVCIAADDRTATITVKDAGPGVPTAEFDKVFEPFYRPAHSHQAVGTGLGLSLVRQIARRHGGDARCVSLDANAGGARSAVVVTLSRLV